jgi:uroporphyrinogen-III synthase
MARWRQLPIFAVGGRTADAVAAIFGVHAKGGSAGSAAALGAVILQAYGLGGESTASGHGELKRKPALFLCSRIARGDLTEVLTAGSIEVDQVVAYDTCGNPFAGDEVVAALSSAIQDSRSPSLRVWVVFFSPSGVSAVLPTLQHCEHTFGKCVYYAAIGRTTATALEDGGVTVHAVAQNPNAEALIASIIESSVD